MAIETIQPKKLLIYFIYDILKNYSDENHRLSITKIGEILENEYNMKVDRKAIKSNLSDLIAVNDDIEYEEITRHMPEKINGKPTGNMVENNITGNYYINRLFDDTELRAIIDSIVFSKSLPQSQSMKLLKKVETLGGLDFDSKNRHIKSLKINQTESKNILFNISCIDEALENNKKLSFSLQNYDVDKKLHRKTLTGTDTPIVYTATPYQIAASNGRYYLICSLDGEYNVKNIRLDKICDMKIINQKAKARSSVIECGINGQLDFQKHILEHIYMLDGPSADVTFLADRSICDEIFDWFGTDIRIFNVTEDTMTVKVHVTVAAMKYWAMQYADFITVLEPTPLVSEIKRSLEKSLERYSKVA